jgi:glutathione S-transferase
MLTLYHGRTSVCSIKVRLVLVEKGIPFDSHILTLRGDQFDPHYVKLNPNAVVPTLVHDDRVIIESTVIAHYIDEAFPDPPLMPQEPLGRAQLRILAKHVDEQVHMACMTLTFATANRAHFAQMAPDALAAELTKTPNRSAAEVKRDVIQHGLDSPRVEDALRQHLKLLDCIEAATQGRSYIGGSAWSLADAVATPYVWRLDRLKLARLWDRRPAVAAWYDRVRKRPSFKSAVEDWVSAADVQRYATQPDPWPKIRDVLQKNMIEL